MIEIPAPLLDFVSIEGNSLVTDSLRVARHFHKRHSNVLRAIDLLACSDEFRRKHYAEDRYIDRCGRNQRMIQMSEDGMIFLVTGFTGAQAGPIKELYVMAYDTMLSAQVHERDKASMARASTGSHLMLERKAVKQAMEAERFRLMAMLQPSLFDQ